MYVCVYISTYEIPLVCLCRGCYKIDLPTKDNLIHRGCIQVNVGLCASGCG